MPAIPCDAPVPRGLPVPAPIVFRTSCGGFRLSIDGGVVRLPRRWFASHSYGTGRRYGADLQVRRTRSGSFRLLSHGRLVWRSSALYPNDGGSVAFGPGEFAFGTYRQGVFLTDLRGRERLVVPGRGRFPVDFTRSGLLLVGGSGLFDVVSPRGTVVRRYRYRGVNGFQFDERTDTLFFVTPAGRLAAANGLHVRLLRSVRPIQGNLGVVTRNLLVFQDQRTIDVTRRDGTRVASARFARGEIDAGVSISTDERGFAFRLTDRGTAIVFVLHAGGTVARAIYRHRLGASGCGRGAGLGWSGRFLLYDSTDGQLAVLDSFGGPPLDVRPFAAKLPEQNRGERADAWWASALA